MRPFFMVFLLLSTSAASAEWLRTGPTTNGIDFYIDTTSISANENLRRVNELQSYIKPRSDGTMSGLIVMEYDCAKKLHRAIQAIGHSEPMAKGKVIWTHNLPTNWDAIDPNSFGEMSRRIVCLPRPSPKAPPLPPTHVMQLPHSYLYFSALPSAIQNTTYV